MAGTALDRIEHIVVVMMERTGEALQKKLDPDHSKGAVHTQIGPGYGTEPMGGFVKAFVKTRKKVAPLTEAAEGPLVGPDSGAGRPYVMHDFQNEFARFLLAMRHVVGLPPGQP